MDRRPLPHLRRRCVIGMPRLKKWRNHIRTPVVAVDAVMLPVAEQTATCASGAIVLMKHCI